MKVSEVARLSNDALRRGLLDLIAHDRTTTVRLLIHLGEFDARRLYREEAYSCMKEYCMGQLAMSEDVAYKRIWVARRARRFPRILVALNDGSLTLSAVAMLTRYLTSANADELLSAAKGKTNARVAELIAQRFPRPDLPTLVQPVSLPQVAWQALPSAQAAASNCQALAVRQVDSVEVSPSSRVMPLAPERHGVQFTIGKSDLDLLCRAQDLLSHQSPSPDAGEIFVRALRAFVVRLERVRCGAPEGHRRAARQGENGRYIPMHVRRVVRERDGDRCRMAALSFAMLLGSSGCGSRARQSVEQSQTLVPPADTVVGRATLDKGPAPTLPGFEFPLSFRAPRIPGGDSLAWGLYVDCPVHLHYAGTYYVTGYLYQDRQDPPVAGDMPRGWSEKSDMLRSEIGGVAPQITTAQLWFPGPSIHRRGHLGEAWVDVQIDSMNAEPPRSVWVRCRVKIDPSVFVDSLPEVHAVD